MDSKEQLAKLQKQFNDAVAAENLLGSNIFDIERQIVETEITRAVQDMASEKFINDHNGYLDARARASFGRRILRRLEATAGLKSEIQRRIDEVES